jgi:hypothetical protein
VKIVFEPVNNASDAVFDEGYLEVDEQAKALVGEPEIGQKLLLVDRGEQLDGFDFHDDLVFDDQIGPESGVDADILITTGIGCWRTVRRPRRLSSYAKTVS